LPKDCASMRLPELSPAKIAARLLAFVALVTAIA
jgi:hypothetical protein